LPVYEVNRPDVVIESFEGEVILVQMKSGNYYSLQGSAPKIWDLIDQGLSDQEIGDWLIARYSGDEDEVRESVQKLVDELATEALIRTAPDTPRTQTGETTPAEPRTAFPPPVLERYTDMQELLLLDPIHDVDESGWPARKVQSEG